MNSTCESCGVQQVYQDCALLSINGTDSMRFTRSSSLPTHNQSSLEISMRRAHRLKHQRDLTIYPPNPSYQRDGAAATRLSILSRGEQPPSPLSRLADRLVPKSSAERNEMQDKVCMTWNEYNKFRETVDMLEYLTYSLKHEALRDVKRVPDHRPYRPPQSIDWRIRSRPGRYMKRRLQSKNKH
ncbi:hypothetical protein ACOME3_002633 [Neoechinorhynchus agilis]